MNRPTLPFSRSTPAAALTAALACATAAPAQESLEALQELFQRQFQQAQERGGLNPEAYNKMLRAQIGRLETFLQDTAKGDDRFNGRLMLVDMHLGAREYTKAQETLGALDVEACPALILLQAAGMAADIGMEGQASAWREIALKKPAPFLDRVTMAMLLMTRFGDPKAGEAIFAEEMAKAGDDERRAEIQWYRATAIREREDLPEGTYYQELQKLADAYPATRYGRIARDRIRAASLTVGDDPLPLDVTTLDGRKLQWSDLAGKVVVLEFWASWQSGADEAAALARSLQSIHGDKLTYVSINVDEQKTLMEKAMAETRRDWPQVFGGKGLQSDVALRWLVEIVPHIVVVGADGKITAVGLHTADSNGRKAVKEAVEEAVAAAGD